MGEWGLSSHRGNAREKLNIGVFLLTQGKVSASNWLAIGFKMAYRKKARTLA